MHGGGAELILPSQGLDVGSMHNAVLGKKIIFWLILPEVISNYQKNIFIRIDREEIAQEDKEKQ